MAKKPSNRGQAPLDQAVVKPMTPSEKQRYEAFQTRREKTPGALKFMEGDCGSRSIMQNLSHGKDNALAGFAAATGSVDHDFSNKLINQAMNSSPAFGMPPVDHANAVVAAMTGFEPQNEMEGLLVAQMVCCHNAAMACLRRAAISEQSFDGRRMNMTFADKFMRTFAAQVEALGKYRKGGQQKVVVEHVHVYPGGQAIIGNVNPTPQGEGGANGGNNETTSCQRAIAQQPQTVPFRLGDGQEMLCPIQEDGRDLPATGHGEREMPYSRR